MNAPEENEETRKTIADVKDMIADMEQRVSNLTCRLLHHADVLTRSPTDTVAAC